MNMKLAHVLCYVREIRETKNLDEAMELMATGEWLIIGVAKEGANVRHPSPEGAYLFSLGRFIQQK